MRVRAVLAHRSLTNDHEGSLPERLADAPIVLPLTRRGRVQSKLDALGGKVHFRNLGSRQPQVPLLSVTLSSARKSSERQYLHVGGLGPCVLSGSSQPGVAFFSVAWPCLRRPVDALCTTPGGRSETSVQEVVEHGEASLHLQPTGRWQHSFSWGCLRPVLFFCSCNRCSRSSLACCGGQSAEKMAALPSRTGAAWTEGRIKRDSGRDERPKQRLRSSRSLTLRPCWRWAQLWQRRRRVAPLWNAPFCRT